MYWEYCHYLSNIPIASNVVGLHHVAAFFPYFLDGLSMDLMAVSAEHVPKVKQPGCLSYCCVSMKVTVIKLGCLRSHSKKVVTSFSLRQKRCLSFLQRLSLPGMYAKSDYHTSSNQCKLFCPFM